MFVTIQIIGVILLVIVASFAWFSIQWTSKIHPNSKFSEAWDCFVNRHDLELYQEIDRDAHLMWCPKCRQPFEYNSLSRPPSVRFWTKDTQQFYTSMNHRIRPLPNAGIQLRKVHGGRAP